MGIADGQLTNIALCWRLERKDGAGIGLTSHDQPVVMDGTTFEPAPGMMPASITRSLGLEPDSSEAAGALSSDALEEADLALGRWDGAALQLTAADWNDPAADQLLLMGGEIGAVAIKGDGFTADLSGAAYQASKRGMLGLAHAIRLEERKNGIRTCVVCPGLTSTELVEKRTEKLSSEVLAKALHSEDVAETILHIAKLPSWVAIPEIQMLPAEL